MMLSKKMENFLNKEKSDIEYGDWDSLFNQAIIEDIGIYSLSKILVQAGINFDFKYRNSGNLLQLLEKQPSLVLLGMLKHMLPNRDLSVENIDSKIYFRYRSWNSNEYLKKDDAPRYIYNTILKWLTGEISGMKDSKLYNDLFSIYDISGHKDPAIMELMLTEHTSYDYSNTFDLWGERPL